MSSIFSNFEKYVLYYYDGGKKYIISQRLRQRRHIFSSGLKTQRLSTNAYILLLLYVYPGCAFCILIMILRRRRRRRVNAFWMSVARIYAAARRAGAHRRRVIVTNQSRKGRGCQTARRRVRCVRWKIAFIDNNNITHVIYIHIQCTYGVYYLSRRSPPPPYTKYFPVVCTKFIAVEYI